MGRPATASAQPTDPFAVDEDRALAELELAWSEGGYQVGQVRAGQHRGLVDDETGAPADGDGPAGTTAAGQVAEELGSVV